MKMQEFHDILDALLELNLENRKNRKIGFEQEMGIKNYPYLLVQELCTVHCDIGRRTGKTEYIRRRCRKGDLIVTFNSDVCDYLSGGVECDVLSASTLLSHKTMKRFSTIFVDEPSVVFQTIPPREFFYLLAKDSNQTFFLLGK